jgi:SAM-dependent methyltransferase
MDDKKNKNHYERWPFPGTDFFSREGLLLLRYFERWIKEERPEKAEKNRVLDAGCGTGHTVIALAKHFPEASFFGVDVSERSIQTALQQTEKIELSNIHFQNKDLREDLASFGQYRIVLSLGVLHHIEDFESGIHNIAQLVEPAGYLVLWLYGALGRFPHSVNQRFLKLMTKDMDKTKSLAIAQSFVKDLGVRFCSGSGFYTPKGSSQDGLAWMLGHPQWLADQMIPAYEKSMTMVDILRHFGANDLEFWKWLGIPTDLRDYTSNEALIDCFDRLSPQDKLIAIDCLIKPSYYFVVGKRKGAQ